METVYQSVMREWLDYADLNYITGRMLWLEWNNITVLASSNLLWLSLEQLIKFLILQKKEPKPPSNDRQPIIQQISYKAKKIGTNHKNKKYHQIENLIEEFNRCYPDFDFTPYLSDLKDLQRLFESRYLSGNSNSIVGFQFTIDKIYFKLRDLVNPEFGEGLIDKICRKKTTGVEQSYQLFEFAYKDNPFFKIRDGLSFTPS